MSFSLSGGVIVTGFISPTDPLDTYPVIDPLYGIDGLRNVDTINDLNNIPDLRRRAGMLVGINNGSQYYKLNPPPWFGTIADWTLVSISTDTFVTGVTYTKDYAVLTRNDNVDVLKLSGGTNVTLNNPSTNEIVIDVTIPPDTNTFVTGFTYDDSNNLTISRNDGIGFTTNIDIMSGLTINGDLLVTGTTNISGLTSINSSLDVYNGTIGLRDNDYFLQGTSTGGTNVQLIGVYSNDEILIGNQGYTNRIMDDTIINGELDILSGLTLSQTPALNNSGTDILIRNSSTGEVEYRLVSSITAATDTFVTGFTYDNANTFTILQNDGSSFSESFNIVTGLTVNGIISATTISGGTLYGDGSNLTGISTQDNFVSGGTYNDNTKEINFSGNSVETTFDVDLSSLVNSVSANTFTTGFTYDNINTFTIYDNSGSTFSTTISTISGVTYYGNGIGLTNIPISGITNLQTELDSKLDVTLFNTYTGDTQTILDTKISGATNLSSEGIFAQKNGFDLEFKGITSTGSSLNITSNSNSVNLDVVFPTDVFIYSGNADASNSTLSFLNTTGGTFTVTNSAALFADNDINVTGGTYNPSTGCVTFTTNSGTTFDVCGFLTGFTDTFVTGGTYSDLTDTITFTNNLGGTFDVTGITDTFTTGATYDNGTSIATFNRNDGNSYTLDLSTIDVNDTFSTGGTVTQSATSGSSEVVVQIVGNSGFTPFNITGLTDTFVNDFSISANTFTISQNDGSSFVATADTIDLASVLSAVTFDIATSGSISATTFNGGTFNGTFVGDGSGLTGITDNNTFVTGGTFNNNTDTITFTNNTGGTFTVTGITDNFVSGGTYNVSTQNIDFSGNSVDTTFSVDLTELVNNVTGDTFVTGTTFASNQATVGRNDGFDVFSLSGGSNVTLSETATNQILIDVTIPPDTNTFVTGGTYNESTDTITLTRNDAVTIDITGVTDNFVIAGTYSDSTDTISLLRQDGSFVNITGVTDTFTTGATYDNGTATATFTRNDGNTYTLDLSTIDVNDTFVTGFTYDDNNTFTITRNDGVDITSSINTVSALTVTNYIDYTTGTKPSAISGRTYFDRDENALSYFPETPANDVTINIGQESVIRVHNNTGVQINNGEVCHITSEEPSVNGVPSVVLAIATGSTTTGSKYLISGVATHDIPNGTEGFITSFGLVRDLNITGVTEGTEIYLSETTPGAFRYTAPDTEFRRSVVGYVVSTGATTGKILVEISNEVGFSELSESLLSVVTENNASTGTRDGGEMTINGGDNTLFDISSGSGIIVDNYTNPNDPTITNVVWGNLTGNTVTNLSADTGSYIFLNSTLNTVQFGISNPPTEADFRDNIFLGIVGHANFTNLINVFNTPIQIVSPINQHQDLTSAIGPFSISGNRILNIPGTLELEKTAGRSFFYGGNFHTDNKVPSNITTSDLSGSTLIYATGTNVLGPTSTDIDPNNYDPDGLGSLSGVPGTNNYVAHRIWHQPSQNLLVFQYGQAFYPNAATARDEFEFENFVVPPGLNEVAYLVAVIIAQDGDTDLDSATIIPQGKFAGTGGGGGSAADTLQTAYDNSSSPEIVTDPTRGAVDFRVGSGSDSDNVVTFQQNSGTINAFVKGTGNAKFETLSGDSLNILSLPTLNNSATDILVRNSSTGVVEYRPVSGITPDTNTFVTGGTYSDVTDTITLTRNDAVTIEITGVTDTFTTGSTYDNGTALATFNRNDGNSYTLDLSTIDVNDTFVTGFTYDNSNTFTLTRNDGVDITTSFNTVTGLTVNGTLSATTLDGNTILSGGTNLTTIIESLDTYVTGGTVSVPATDNTNSGTIGLFYKNSDGTPRTLPFEDTYTTGSTYDNGTALATFDRNDGTSYTLDLSAIDVNDTFVTGSTVSANTLTLTRNDLQDVLLLSGGSNVQFIDNGNNSITLNATTSGGGASVSFPWKFKDPTASGDPGSGQFRLNNTVASAITEIYVNDFTNNGIDASNLLNILDVGDVIYIQQNDDASRAVLFTVSASTVDNTGWFTIPVQYQQGSTIPKKDKICGWIFASTGAEDNTVSNVGVGQGVFKQRNVNDFEFYSLSGGTNTTIDLSGDTIVISSEDIYVIAGTYVDNTDTITLLRNDGNFVNITGVTDTFTTGSTYDNGTATATFNRNDGNSYTLDLSSIDVNDTFSTGGTVTQSSSNNNSNQTIQIVGNDGFSSYNITGITDTFTTGGTYNNGTALITFDKNDGTSYDVDLSSLDLNDTFVTGFTYNDANTLTITRNDGVDITTSFNIVTGLTVNGDLTVTGETSLQSTTASTITLSSTPTENNTNTEILSRNSSTGVVEYRDIATFGVNITTVTATTYTAITTDDVIGFDTTSVSPTLFLPDSTTIGRIRYEVKDIGVNSRRNPITIQAAGSDTIITTSVVSSFELSADGGAVILVSTGTGQWWQM